jgi:thiosulfate/3-mercaptopyruvate sulfurtransferase
MPAAEELRTRLEALGISNDSRVVVYYGKDWVSPSTRIVFTLDYAGLGARTSLLDGGMREWIRAGNEVTDAATPVRKGTLAKLKVKPIVVDAACVRAHLDKPGFQVVDGRSPVFYDGVETGGGGMHAKHKTGHLPGAGSLPFTSITDDRGLLLPRAELKALLDKAGVEKGDTVVGYCHIGQQTTAALFVARLFGHDVRLYDGSMQDWSRRDFPVVNPQEARR